MHNYIMLNTSVSLNHYV